MAVIGASRRRGTVGGEIFHNLLESGFEGVVHPVNPATDVVQSVRAYRSVADVPGEVDLAVIAVPARSVLAVARECAAKGVRALTVISAGFAEVGEEGAKLQRELVELCRGAGMRLSGPTAWASSTWAEGSRLNATFAPGMPPPGNVGFVTQSGALGLALIDLAGDRGLGVSSFASIGNRADVTANDFLEYWEERSGHRRGPALHRVLQRPAALLAPGAADWQADADRRRQERPLGLRGAGDQLAHRGAARGVRRDRRRALRAGRRDPHRDARRAAGRRLPARQSASAAGAPGGDSDQRGWAGNHVRRRLRGGRPAGARAARTHSASRCASSSRRRPRWPTRWT